MLKIIRQLFPVILGYLLVGISFSVLAIEQGLSTQAIISMSAFV